MKKENFLWLLTALFLAGNIFWVWYVFVPEQSETSSVVPAAPADRRPYADFLFLLADKIFWAEGEVDFETRLALENSVRALEDEEILNQWNYFVDSANEETAREEIRSLTILLLNKLRR